MNLYHLSMFSPKHFGLIAYSILLFFVFDLIHKNIPTKYVRPYSICFGIFLLVLKLFDSYNLVFHEKAALITLLPLNICNIALIFAAIYLITKIDIFFNFLYFLSFGVVLALLFPDYSTYHDWYYPFIYYSTHMFEYIALAFGIMHYGTKITKENYIKSNILLSALIVINTIVNHFFGSNFMFLRDYAVGFLSIIKPLLLYQVIIVTAYYLIFYLMYRYIIKYEDDENNN